MKSLTPIRSLAASIVALALTVAPAFAVAADQADAPAPAPVTELKPAPQPAPDAAKPFDPDATGPDKVQVPDAVEAEPQPLIPGDAAPVPLKKVAFIGIGSLPLDAAAALKLPEGVGLRVVAVMPDTPAAAAGVKVGDVLHKLDDQMLVNCDQFRTLVRIHKPGDEIAVTVIRDGKPVELKAKLIERLVPAVEPNNVFRLAPGVNIQPLGQGQRLHVGPNGLIEIHPLELQPGQPIDPEQMRRQIEEHIKQIRRQIEQQDGNIPQPNAAPGANASATVAMTDNEHNIKYAINNGDKHLTVKDKAGKVLFDGPVNTDEQRKAIPDGVRQKFEKLEKQTNINIQVLPNPFAPPPTPAPDKKPDEVLG